MASATAAVVTDCVLKRISEARLRGYVTDGLRRALEWHSRGQRFDPAYLHHERHKSEIRFRKEADFCLCSKGHYVQAAVELLKVNIKVDVQLIVPANLHPLD